MKPSSIVVRGAAALVLVLPGIAAAQGAVVFTAEGAAPGDAFGAAVSGAGDVDRDGTPDVIVGARRHDGPAGADVGRAVVLSGRTGAVLRVLDGEGADDRFGSAVSGAGDLDGDGTPDLLVGAPGWDGPAGTDAGRVYVYSGATGALVRTHEGEAAFDLFGRGLDTLGDVNGDGVQDFVAGAEGHEGPAGPSAGRVYGLSGATGATLFTADGEAPDARLGFSLARAGDTNGDGLADFVAGAYGFTRDGILQIGRAYVYGGDGALLRTFEGEAQFDFFGFSVDGAGDADGDGRADVIVGAWGFDGVAGGGTGRAYLYSGATGALVRTIDGAGVADFLGTAVAGLGDVDADGTPDQAIGAPGFNGAAGLDAGKMYVVSGATGAAIEEIEGEAAGAKFGSALASTFEAGDGAPTADLIAGAPDQDVAAGAGGGKVQVRGYCNDADADGYGAPRSAACPEPFPDCVDTNPAVHPFAPEIPGNFIDDNCNGIVDLCGSVPSDAPAGAGTWLQLAAAVGALALSARRRRGRALS